ncbi:MAG: Crp/Fnr family transcriptional regulator [bacterium]
MKQQEILEILGKVMLFQRLDQDQLERIARLAATVRLSEGESLFEQQDPAERFYLLVTGQIKLYRLSADGSEKVIEVINPGATFAEALMFMEKPSYPVGAQALKDSELVSIDAKDFVSMLRQSVDTLLMVAADLSQRLHGLIRELNDLSLHTGTCRVATYFIQQQANGADQFDLDLPKQILASRLSIKPETLSRIFRSLTNAGLIEISGNKITILDRMHLSDLADVCSSGETSLLSTFYHRP